MREVEYVIPIPGPGDVIRVRYASDRGRILVFTVQYEAWIDGAHRPVVRFDSQHGRPHRDILDWEGDATKDWDWAGASLPLNAAITAARDDIREHWSAYREAFLRRKP